MIRIARIQLFGRQLHWFLILVPRFVVKFVCHVLLLPFDRDQIEMELITAVISGDRTLEARILASKDLTVAKEQRVTSGLCRIMDQADKLWKRYVFYCRQGNFI